ncbi:ParB/RepB/Spo0J family partition protein [Streptomyces lavendulae]|uniref:Plasmid partitioning protein ParB n=2 Tax=Streptomycetaceae TaxID=2062 RepID=E1ARK8_KITAU|nr:ParB/RepB/Spo0J family partition protein [Streptomyces lavendulae]ADM72827.2 plasmid partitioning protein ParB [Streptomyces lavendulae subsp. lavendulae]ATZ29843.1 Chromosome-partitioning protein Spo0J [Streptomyces lavendulae subsp. lavendulae]
MSKADKLGVSASFARAQPVGVSSRRAAIAEATGAPTSGVVPPSEVPIDALAHNPFNLREDLTDLAELAESLTVRGQLQPLAVATRMAFMEAHPGATDGLGRAPYVVIDGNRRLAAAHLAGLKTIQIHVNDSLSASAADILESALIANVHRVDVAPMDQARALQELVDVHGSQAQVAKRIGKTAAWVSQRLTLLNLTPTLQEKVETGELKVEPARRIGRLPQEEQAAAADESLSAVNPPRQRTRPAPATANPQPQPQPQPPAPTASPSPSPSPSPSAAPAPRITISTHSPETIADALTAHLTPDDLKAVTELLMTRI